MTEIHLHFAHRWPAHCAASVSGHGTTLTGGRGGAGQAAAQGLALSIAQKAREAHATGAASDWEA
eukprot:COSAG01_NODE_31468_length_597_cov_0.815261_2_plen_64_part_01